MVALVIDVRLDMCRFQQFDNEFADDPAVERIVLNNLKAER
jgi:hypothetical protein